MYYGIVGSFGEDRFHIIRRGANEKGVLCSGHLACVELGSGFTSVPYPLVYGSLASKTWVWLVSRQEDDDCIFLVTEQAHVHCEEGWRKRMVGGD